MQALRQFHTAEQGRITIQLPADFPATEVEVIILPNVAVTRPVTVDTTIQEDEGQATIQAFLTMDTIHFTPAEQQAYERTVPSYVKRVILMTHPSLACLKA